MWLRSRYFDNEWREINNLVKIVKIEVDVDCIVSIKPFISLKKNIVKTSFYFIFIVKKQFL